ncbi:TPA: hypothetical protein ACHU8I_001159, partial [Streptococcus suis]
VENKTCETSHFRRVWQAESGDVPKLIQMTIKKETTISPQIAVSCANYSIKYIPKRNLKPRTCLHK